MSNPSMTINLSVNGRAPLDLLQIEQGEWSTYTAMVTKTELAEFVKARLWGGSFTSSIDCGFDDGEIVCEIFVYPRDPFLLYQFNSSWGRLGPRQESRPELEEIINFRLTDAESPQYPAEAIHSAHWMAECYDSSGAVVSNPPLFIDGGTLRISPAVYGSVRVRYQTNRHRYVLRCPRRYDAHSNHYTAVVYGVYAGGINWKIVDMPPDIKKFEQDENTACGWGSYFFGPEDKELPVIANRTDRKTDYDYCLQTIIRDETHVVG
jgi:hypothetical protein